MDAIEKALQKLSQKEQEQLKIILKKLQTREASGLNIVKLKGYLDIFRVRKGRLRIIFRMENGNIFLLKIDRRSDTTYSEF